MTVKSFQKDDKHSLRPQIKKITSALLAILLFCSGGSPLVAVESNRLIQDGGAAYQLTSDPVGDIPSSDAAESSSNAAESSSDAAESSSNAAESSSDAAESSSDAAESSSDAAESSSDVAESSSNLEINQFGFGNVFGLELDSQITLGYGTALVLAANGCPLILAAGTDPLNPTYTKVYYDNAPVGVLNENDILLDLNQAAMQDDAETRLQPDADGGFNLASAIVVGGGYKTDIPGNTQITMLGGKCNVLAGGGFAASSTAGATVSGSTNITVDVGDGNNGPVTTMGGGYCMQGSSATAPTIATVLGGTNVQYLSGTGGSIYGGGWSGQAWTKSVIKGGVSLTVTANGTFTNLCGGNYSSYTASQGEITGGVNVTAENGTFTSLYGGGYTSSNETTASVDNVTINLQNVQIGVATNINSYFIGGCYGGGVNNVSNVTGPVSITVTDSTVNVSLYAGGVAGGEYATANVGSTSVVVNGGSLANIYGGGWTKAAKSTTAKITGNTEVRINSGEISGSVCGGGGNASVANSPINPVHLVDVGGSTSVIITGGHFTNSGTLPTIIGGGRPVKVASATAVSAYVEISGGIFEQTGSIPVVCGGSAIVQTDQRSGVTTGKVSNSHVKISGGSFKAPITAGGRDMDGCCAVTGTALLEITGGSGLTLASGKVAAGGTSKVYISGGSVVKNSTNVVPQASASNTTPLYLTTVTLQDENGNPVANEAVAAIDTTAGAYGTQNVVTDADGKLYLWIPDGESVLRADCAGAVYAGSVTAETSGAAAGILTPAEYKPVTNVTLKTKAAYTWAPVQLAGEVSPADATYREIAWSIQKANGTGAAVTAEGILTTTNAGTVTLRATVANGLTEDGTPFTQDIDLVVYAGELVNNGLSYESGAFYANGNPLLIMPGSSGLNFYYDFGTSGVKDAADYWINLNELAGFTAQPDANETTGFTFAGSGPSVYGGRRDNITAGDTGITLLGGRLSAIYGGGYAATTTAGNDASVTGTTRITIKDGTVMTVCGGSNSHAAASVQNSIITIEGGTVTTIYAGGSASSSQATSTTANVLSTATVNLNGGTVTTLYGGGYAQSGGSATITAEVATSAVNVDGATVTTLYGGGYARGKAVARVSTSTVNLNSGTATNVYGGGYATASGAVAEVSTSATVNVKGAAAATLYGGGKGENMGQANVTNSAVNIVQGNYPNLTVYTGGNAAAVGNGKVTNGVLNISGGTVNGDFKSGDGNMGQMGTSTINITGGMVSGTVATSDGTVTTRRLYISGGNVSAAISGMTPYWSAENYTRVYKTTLTLQDAGGAAVESLTTDPAVSYGLNDVMTDASGKLTVYLPASTKAMKATAGGNVYANVSGVTSGQSGTLTLFVPATGISGLPTTAVAGDALTLTGAVEPDNATFQTIVWSLVDAGTTGAALSGSTLNVTSAGTVTLKAAVKAGAASGDLEQQFTISVREKRRSIALSMDSYDFGTEASRSAFEAKKQTVTITNDGELPVTLNRVECSGFVTGEVTSVEGKTLQPNETTQFTVYPAAWPGDVNQTLTVTIQDSADVTASMNLRYRCTPDIQSIVAFDPIKAISSGAPKTVAGLGLQETAELLLTTTAENNKTITLPVNWNVAGCAYDPTNLGYQKFTVTGTIEIPDYLKNPSGFSSTLSVEVELRARRQDAATGVIVNGQLANGQTVLVTPIKPAEQDYAKLWDAMGRDCNPLGAYRLQLSSRAVSSKYEIEFPVSAGYNGKNILVVQQSGSSYQNHAVTVHDGKAILQTDELSNFMLGISIRSRVEVSTEAQLRQAILDAGSNPVEIVLKANITCTSKKDDTSGTIYIKDGMDVIITDDGTPRTLTFNRPADYPPTVVVEQGGKLTFRSSTGDNLTVKLDGGYKNYTLQDNFTNDGTLIFNDVILPIVDAGYLSIRSAGVLRLNGCKVSGAPQGSNTSATNQYFAGAIRLVESSDTEITGCTFDSFSKGSSVYAFGAVTRLVVRDTAFTGNGKEKSLSDGSTLRIVGAGNNAENGAQYVEITDCTFAGNKALAGGALDLGGVKEAIITNSVFSANQATNKGGAIYFHDKTKATLDNVTVEKCFVQGNSYGSGSGGGMYIETGAEVTMNGGKVTECKVENNASGDSGGGIMVEDPGLLVLDGAVEISKNTAEMGGGIHVHSNSSITDKRESLVLKSAHIFENTATISEGGGIFMNNNVPLRMDNTIIRNNTATTQQGGGVWACPLGALEGYSYAGMAVYGNKVTGGSNRVGSDLFVSAPGSTAKEILVPEFALGGGSFNWQKEQYLSGSPQRTPAGKEYYQKELNGFGDNIALYSGLSAEDIAAAEALATVIIENNKAIKGGGVAINGPTNTGYPGEVKVTKVWAGDVDPNQPASVEVQLYKNDVAVGAPVELNILNGWSHIWPKTDLTAVWTVKEITNLPQGYQPPSYRGQGTEDVTITNTYQASGQPPARLIVTKEIDSVDVWGNPVVIDRAQEFEFTVVIGDNPTTEYTYAIDGGVHQKLKSGGTIKLKHGQRAAFLDLPAGTSYTVTERNDFADYVSFGSNTIGRVDAEDVIASFVNRKADTQVLPGGVSSLVVVDRILANEEDIDNTKQFEVTITIGTNAAKTYEYQVLSLWASSSGLLDYYDANDPGIPIPGLPPPVPDPDRTSDSTAFDKIQSVPVDTSTSNKITVMLRHGEAVVVYGIPVGTYYTVSQVDYSTIDGYAIDSTVNTSGVILPDKDVLPDLDTLDQKLLRVRADIYNYYIKPITYRITVQKEWDPAGPAAHPTQAVVKLKHNGKFDSRSMSTINNWTAEFEVTVRNSLEAAALQLAEEKVPNYEGEFTLKSTRKPDADTIEKEWVLTNTYKPGSSGGGDDDGGGGSGGGEGGDSGNGYYSRGVVKVWTGPVNEKQPDTAEMQLYRNGVPYGSPVLLSKASGWSYRWDFLDDRYSWSINEVNVPDDYKKSVRKQAGITIIENHYEGEEETPTENPPTGDKTSPLPGMTAFLLGCCGAAYAARQRKRKHQ